MLLKLAASPFIVKLVSSTIQVNRDLQNTKLAAILSVFCSVENRLHELFPLTGSVEHPYFLLEISRVNARNSCVGFFSTICINLLA